MGLNVRAGNRSQPHVWVDPVAAEPDLDGSVFRSAARLVVALGPGTAAASPSRRHRHTSGAARFCVRRAHTVYGRDGVTTAETLPLLGLAVQP